MPLRADNRVAEMGDLPSHLRERLHEMACEIAHLVRSAQVYQLPEPPTGAVLPELQRLVDRVRDYLLAALNEPTLTADSHHAVTASLRCLRYASTYSDGRSDAATVLEEGLIGVLGCLYHGEADSSGLSWRG